MPTLAEQYEAARKANEERYAQAMQIYDKIISQYRPGGAFQTAQLEELERRKGRETGREMQQMISSGMYGTTTAAGIPRRWEAEVGVPARLKLEDIMMQRLSQAQVGKAGFIERREDVYPDVRTMAGYTAQAAAARPTTTVFPQMGPGPLERSRMLFGGATTTAPTTAAPSPTQVAEPARRTTPTEPAPRPGTPADLWAKGQWQQPRPLEDIMAGVTYAWAGQGGAGGEADYQEYVSAVKSLTPTAQVISQELWERIGKPSGASYLARYR